MCCTTRTHVIVLSKLCLVFTGISAIFNGRETISAFLSGNSTNQRISDIYAERLGLAAGIQAIIHVVWITSEILCIIGAAKYKRGFLIPFMICLSLQIVACIGFSVLVGVIFGYIHFALAMIYIIPLVIALGVTIYILVIVINFYRELARGIVQGVHTGMMLQPHILPTDGGDSNAEEGYRQQGELGKLRDGDSYINSLTEFRMNYMIDKYF